MNPKLLIARWTASRIEARTRSQRRALRDYQRMETMRIQSREKRSRGLRLYIAWSHLDRPPVQPRPAGNWHETPLAHAA
jgi:hypothetical protein